MELRSYIIFVFVALNLEFTTSDIRYILPSTKAATCPSANNCFILSHVAENNFTWISGLNTTLLFMPGNHTLTSSLTIKNLSSFVMIANKHLPRPVINCEQQSMFSFISIAYIRIDGLSLNGCLNEVSMINEFIMKDIIMLGHRNASRRALFVKDSSIIVVGSQFESFNEAIYLLQSSSRISHCTFSNNTALTKGGALRIEDRCNITIEHSTFSFHTCYRVHSCEAGAVLYSTDSELLITNCTFDNNKDGAIAVVHSKVRIVNSYFLGNVAWYGAAIQAHRNTLAIVITDTHFCYNEPDSDIYKLDVYTVASPGGAIRCWKCKVEIIRGIFEHNKGAAVLGIQAQIKIKSCQFSNNTAAKLGGGVYASFQTNLEIAGTTLFDNNVASYGAAFHAFSSIVSIVGTISIVNNTANLGAVSIIHSTAIIRANVIFSGNIGSFFAYSGKVRFIPLHSGKVNFTCTGNYQTLSYKISKYVGSEIIREGGAITLFISRLELQGKTNLSHNTASNGGGIIAITSTIVCNSTLLISNNYVTDTGGGIYLYQSELSIFGNITISNNRANVCGGGLHAISAFLKLIPRSRSINIIAFKGIIIKLSIESNFAVWRRGLF